MMLEIIWVNALVLLFVWLRLVFSLFNLFFLHFIGRKFNHLILNLI